MLDITKIRIDGTQSRVEINEATVQEYADAIKNGTKFPPVVVFFDGVDYWLADGFHRFLAHQRAGQSKIQETVTPGTMRDAILYSAGANHAHGLRRTNADKRKSVLMLLNDAEWCQWADTKIAEMCRVDRSMVADERKRLTCGNQQVTERTYTTKHGTKATMQTSNIGRSAAEVMRDVLEPESKQPEIKTENAEEDEIPEEYRLLVLTREQELEQQVRELGDCLEDTSKALADLAQGDAEGYISESRKMRREIEALTVSRDALLFENAQLKKHIKYLEKKYGIN